jgi:hypothetical protein
MKNTEADKNNTEYLFRCDCHDFHFLQLSWWPKDKHTDVFLEGYLSLGGTDFWHTLKDRVKYASRTFLL